MDQEFEVINLKIKIYRITISITTNNLKYRVQIIKISFFLNLFLFAIACLFVLLIGGELE